MTTVTVDSHQALEMVRANLAARAGIHPRWTVGVSLIDSLVQCQDQANVLQHMLDHIEADMPFSLVKPEIDLIVPVFERFASRERNVSIFHPDDPMIPDDIKAIRVGHPDGFEPLLDTFMNRTKLRAALRSHAAVTGERRAMWLTVLGRYLGRLREELAEWGLVWNDWQVRNPDVSMAVDMVG